jgi:hypothetical protein
LIVTLVRFENDLKMHFQTSNEYSSYIPRASENIKVKTEKPSEMREVKARNITTSYTFFGELVLNEEASYSLMTGQSEKILSSAQKEKILCLSSLLSVLPGSFNVMYTHTPHPHEHQRQGKLGDYNRFRIHARVRLCQEKGGKQ